MRIRNSVSIILLSIIVIIGDKVITYKNQFTPGEIPHPYNGQLDLDNLIQSNYPHSSLVSTKKNTEGIDVVVDKTSIDKFYNKKSSDYIGALAIPVLKLGDAIYRDKGDFYLSHDFKKDSSKPGELYLDSRSAEQFSYSGALVNGHAMANGTKFGKIKNLLTIETQPELYLWDEFKQQLYRYQINSVSLIDGDNSGLVMDFHSEDERLAYYESLYKTALKKWAIPDLSRKVLLLNTCSYIINDGHYIVLATLEGAVKP